MGGGDSSFNIHPGPDIANTTFRRAKAFPAGSGSGPRRKRCVGSEVGQEGEVAPFRRSFANDIVERYHCSRLSELLLFIQTFSLTSTSLHSGHC